ncbi:MAG TPA: tetratricopeptide repeat protein [Polyangiales bacterium]|nr:tetratricopeptide repeat protein [Polyangiales bacterium]
MTREAPDGSAHALFAHRHLAELQLAGSPWRAALHLRRVIEAGAADDSAHALMGLSQALLGNYRVAVSAYRKAVKLAPRNPWYHHNLGHLLDVGLSDSTAALDHLRVAHRIEPDEDEIAASLAHCLARLGQLNEARRMAELALTRSPKNREHRALLDWILEGAPSNATPASRVNRRPTGRFSVQEKAESHAPSTPQLSHLPATSNAPSASNASNGSNTPHTAHQPHESHESHESIDAVLALIENNMLGAGEPAERLARARALWSDFCGRRAVRSTKPAVYAAAVEYALAKLDGSANVTQARLAQRYGVAARSIGARYDEIRNVLALEPGDPRYVGEAN